MPAHSRRVRVQPDLDTLLFVLFGMLVHPGACLEYSRDSWRHLGVRRRGGIARTADTDTKTMRSAPGAIDICWWLIDEFVGSVVEFEIRDILAGLRSSITVASSPHEDRASTLIPHAH